MATFVLVHGAWAGGVVWRQLAPRLRKAAHEVLPPRFPPSRLFGRLPPCTPSRQ